jgi:hypothetical protein
MKIRSEINKRKRFAIKLTYLGFAVFLFILLLSLRYEMLVPFSFVGLAIGIFGLIYASFWIKCPKCKQVWGYMALYGGLLSIPKRVKFCPFCGYDIGAEF